MSLKTKFLFLVIGITIIPFLIAIAVMASLMTGEDTHTIFKEYLTTRRWIRKNLYESGQDVDLNKLINDKPKSVEFIVLDGRDKLIYSSVKLTAGGGAGEAAEGTAATRAVSTTEKTNVLEYIYSHSRDYEFQIVSRKVKGRGTAFFLVQVPRIENSFVEQRYILPLGLPLLLLIFSSAMSIYIVRNIRSSIASLEHATRKIADGDLDFSLEVRGNDEIASLKRSFNTMRQKVKDEYARRARFIMGVSHDLKTPLALIEGYVDAIQDGYADQPEKMERYLSIIKEKSKILEQRIGRLIDFVKLETEDWKLTNQDVNMLSFLHELTDRYSEDAEILGYPFKANIEVPANLSISMDKELVLRAFENLINNAIRYSIKGGTIELRAGIDSKAHPNRLDIDISNYGAGITEEELSYIFDPFYRGSNSRREEGLGLGLSTVKSIIQSHGWSINVKSLEESGPLVGAVKIVFTVSIPLEV